MYFDQSEYDIRFEWGLSGVEAFAPVSDVVVIVDVLSFTTCVDIVVGRDGFVLPYLGKLNDLAAFAHTQKAIYANPARKHEAGFSLGPLIADDNSRRHTLGFAISQWFYTFSLDRHGSYAGWLFTQCSGCGSTSQSAW